MKFSLGRLFLITFWASLVAVALRPIFASWDWTTFWDACTFLNTQPLFGWPVLKGDCHNFAASFAGIAFGVFIDATIALFVVYLSLVWWDATKLKDKTD